MVNAGVITFHIFDSHIRLFRKSFTLRTQRGSKRQIGIIAIRSIDVNIKNAKAMNTSPQE